MTTAIETHGAGKLYERGGGSVGLHGVTLDVPRGQVLAVLGHNGAGKTTLVRGLATLLAFDRGTARVAGFDVAQDARHVRERIALVGQGVAVDEQLTAMQNLVLFGRLRGLNRLDAQRCATRLLEDFGIGDDGRRPVVGFSGGMRRRLDVAASMIVRPEVLFVDEPTTGLDPSARRNLWDVLRGLVASGTTVLLTTQYLEEADALADHIVLLAHGKPVAEGSSDDLKGMLGHSLVHLRFASQEQAASAMDLLSSTDPELVSPSGLSVSFKAEGPVALVESVRVLGAQGVAPVEASLRNSSLDEVFLTLTDKTPSDDTSQEATS